MTNIYKINGQLVYATYQEVVDCCCPGCPDDCSGCPNLYYVDLGWAQIPVTRNGCSWYGVYESAGQNYWGAIECVAGEWWASWGLQNQGPSGGWSMGPANKTGAYRCPP